MDGCRIRETVPQILRPLLHLLFGNSHLYLLLQRYIFRTLDRSILKLVSYKTWEKDRILGEAQRRCDIYTSWLFSFARAILFEILQTIEEGRMSYFQILTETSENSWRVQQKQRNSVLIGFTVRFRIFYRHTITERLIELQFILYAKNGVLMLTSFFLTWKDVNTADTIW